MTMYQPEKLSELISEIYDAAVDPSLWRDVVGKAGRFVGGLAAAIFAKSAATGNGRHLIAVADWMPYREFLETSFYKERAHPQGPDCVSAVLDKSVSSATLFGVFRHEREGIVDDETRRRMRLIVPHIRRAVQIGRDIDLKSAEAAPFADTLDGLSAGICLVDADGRILHAMSPVKSFLAPAISCPRSRDGSSQAMRRLIERFVGCSRPPAAAMRQSQLMALHCH